MKRVCPNCAKFISRKEQVCPYCQKPTKREKINYSKADEVKIKNNKKDSGKKSKNINTNTDKYGTINIATNESIYYNSAEYSAKKARGEYEPEKLKWWEIYKWADRLWTRNKIKKVVNKNSNQPPENLSYASMLILTLLTGFTGLHNIYAKNYKRGIIMLSLFSISMAVVGLVDYLPFLEKVQYSIGGFFGFVVLLMWVFDIFRVIFKKYIYKLSKIEFIKMLDIETRAKLGKKYIDMSKFDKKTKKIKEEVDDGTAVA